MPDIPRRLPPTPAERLNVVVSRMAGGSSAGATRWAQPVRGTTYRPADALGHAETPVSTAPLLAVLMSGHSVDYDSGDPTRYDVLALPGLMPGRIYLVEIVALTSGGYGQDPAPDGSASITMGLVGPTTDTGTSELFFNVESGLAQALDVYADTFWGLITDPLTAIGTVNAQFTLGVNYGAPSPSTLTLQAANVSGGTALVHQSTYIRATDIGAVPQIS